MHGYIRARPFASSAMKDKSSLRMGDSPLKFTKGLSSREDGAHKLESHREANHDELIFNHEQDASQGDIVL
jgi:hypothetical protein